MALEFTPRMIAGIYFHGHRDVHERPQTPYSPTNRDWARHKLASLFLVAGDPHSVASADNYLRLLGMGDKTIRAYREVLNAHVGKYIDDLVMSARGLTIQMGDEFYLGVRINGESLPLSQKIEWMRDNFIEDLKRGALGKKPAATHSIETDGSSIRPTL